MKTQLMDMYDRARVGAVVGGTYPAIGVDTTWLRNRARRFHEVVAAVGCKRRKVLFGVTGNDGGSVIFDNISANRSVSYDL
ncbi:uncharacterized protein LOC110880842 isoform X2 [Helianthus annuus]|nr:uncharacterized protein LOC110880842 isoform X2 [Helianthus annuus]